MKQTAKVVRVEGELVAEVTRNEACAHCGACAHGRSASHYYPLLRGDYREGDTVEISLDDDHALSASLIAYGVPLLCLIAGLLIGVALKLPELWQAGLALGMLVVSYFVLKALDPKLRQSGRYEPHFPCEKQP